MSENAVAIPDDFENQNSRIENETLNKLRNTSDVAEYFQAVAADLEDYSDEYGSGFEILDKKERLVDEGFVIVAWQFNTSKEYGGKFVTAYVITERGDKFILNDGSTGIRDQLYKVTETRRARGVEQSQKALMVRKGLRASRYTYVDDNGKETQATTYYLGQ